MVRRTAFMRIEGHEYPLPTVRIINLKYVLIVITKPNLGLNLYFLRRFSLANEIIDY